MLFSQLKLHLPDFHIFKIYLGQDQSFFVTYIIGAKCVIFSFTYVQLSLFFKRNLGKELSFLYIS